MATALKVQASLNGGAWPFDEFERARLFETEGMIEAYLPDRARSGNANVAGAADPVTRSVTAQYEAWPYPSWTRITVGEKTRLPDVIQVMDPEVAKALPVEANILIAGCGTGRQAAYAASEYPDATVTAIDVSEASLDYARRQCAILGINNVHFVKLDLHDAGNLNQRFHAVFCGGVLHHLPDPERGLKVIADLLQPGGVMHIMVYSRVQRLRINAARALIGDLMQEPSSDDLLRQVRQRFLQRPEHPLAAYIMTSGDFATLAGTHDLLMNVHEDAFDIARIERALAHAGMRMLSFKLPSPAVAARYEAMFPHDPKHNDIKSWASFEMRNLSALAHNYEFWCCKRQIR
jgi:2-polyprenyl-3-methyl-5-hydroxy-6-metoxy-1,4-benzoquinol methylase